MKKIAMLLVVAYATMLTACNTIEGFGRDVEKVGDNIERKAAHERRN
jgi:predicted small secreted protein